MNLLQRVMALKSEHNNLPTADNWIYVTHILCKTYGWDYYILKKQPMKFVFNMMAQIAWDKKKEKEYNDSIGKK